MGQFSVKIYGATGSALSAKQHFRGVGNTAVLVCDGAVCVDVSVMCISCSKRSSAIAPATEQSPNIQATRQIAGWSAGALPLPSRTKSSQL